MKFRKVEQDETASKKRRQFRDFNQKIRRLKAALECGYISLTCYWTKISLI